MDDYDDTPSVVDEGLAGWVWDRDLRGARYYGSLTRWDNGRLSLTDANEEHMLSAKRSTVYPTEEAALLGLEGRHLSLAQAHAEQAGRIRRRRQRLSPL